VRPKIKLPEKGARNISKTSQNEDAEGLEAQFKPTMGKVYMTVLTRAPGCPARAEATPKARR